MATIYARFNTSSKPWNPLEPQNWVGDVVPGPGDTARFNVGYQTTAGGSTFNANVYYNALYFYFSGTQYSNYGPNWNYNRPIPRSRFTSGSSGTAYTSSFWTDNWARGFFGRNAWATASNGTALAYGSTGDDKYSKGFYNNQFGMSAVGKRADYTEATNTQYNIGYKDKLYFYSAQYGPYYDRARCRTYYAYNYVGNYTSQFTFDGVTLKVQGDRTSGSNGMFTTMSRPFGVSKEEYYSNPDHTNDYTRIDKLFDYATGSALAVENGGRWNIYGPHNGRGRHVGAILDRYNSISFWMVSESMNSTPAMSSLGNGLQYDDSSYLRSYMNIFPSSSWEDWGPLDIVHTSESLWIQQESSASMRYASSSVEADGRTIFRNANNNHSYSWYQSGSGHVYAQLMPYQYHGYGPGNHGQVKFNIKNLLYGNAPVELSYDPSYSTWVSSSTYGAVSETPINPKVNDPNNQVTGKMRIGTHYLYTDTMLQNWELTGSQHWQVGAIDMSYKTHFHVKDQSKITLIDMGSSKYPAIDFTDYSAAGATLLVTDEATLQLSSSRTSLPSSIEGGIYTARNQCSVIISGSANYSHSLAPSSSTAGDSTIMVSNLQSTFGIGDYISIESTGSLRIKDTSDDVDLFFTGSDWPRDKDSGSLQELRGRHTSTQYQRYYATPVVGESFTTQNIANNKYSIFQEYSNTCETDEIVQVATMSGDHATVIKMFGKEGEIQSDMGLFTYDQFTETFDEAPSQTFDGSKRVVLVDSNHLNFKQGDNLVISGSNYTVLHATKYLSQSCFYEFTSSNQPPLEEVFDIETAQFSGSSIWPINTSTYGITQPSVYYTEAYKKDRLLITGSFKGSEFYQDDLHSNAYNSNRYGGASGSDNGYRALRLDPTLAYGWRNWNNTSNYDYHEVVDYGYFWGRYHLDKTFNFREGEIIVSGSQLRDGFFDPTSSNAYEAQNSYGVGWGESNYYGAGWMTEQDNHHGRYAYYQYQHPYPYLPRANMSYNTHGPCLLMGSYNKHANTPLSNMNHWSSKSSSFGGFSNNNNPEAAYRYVYSGARKTMYDDPTFPEGFDGSSLWLSGSAPRGTIASASNRAGTSHIRVNIEDGRGELYAGANGVEILANKFFNESGRGKVSLQLNNYASIYSVNVKIRWQQLILDTQDTFNYRDRIHEGGLLYDHYPNHEVKHIATEVVDAKGFKNLIWTQEYEKGDSDIRPYTYAVCYTGTTAGTTSNTGHERVAESYAPGRALIPGPYIPSNLYAIGQANANFYHIYDLRTQVEFDTIGMCFSRSTTYGIEYDVDNKMNDIRFEVCDDVGLATPAWETVVATYDDERSSTGDGGIRFYHFPSGSVNKRFIKYHSRGGTKSSAYYYHSFFGIYNMSASCAASDTLTPSRDADGNENYTGLHGAPSASLCQVELANTKNFKVGDLVYFWSKQMQAEARLQKTSTAYSNYYKNMQSTSNWYQKTTTQDDFVGGFWNIHEITAKSGNTITLDKPITHTHIGKGTMCYKYNRGNVRLIGERQPFMIYKTSNNNFSRLQNVTFINGYYRKDEIDYDWTPTYMSDVGMLTYHEGYYGYHQGGVYKNIVGNGPAFGGYSNYMGNAPSVQRFNCMRSYNANNLYRNIKPSGMRKTVLNFDIALHYVSSQTYIYSNDYYGSPNIYGHFYYRNSFARLGVYMTPAYYLAGNIGNTLRHHNYNDYIHVDNITVGSYSFRDDNSAQYNYANNIRRNYSHDELYKNINVHMHNQWFFPNITNPRSRPGFYIWNYTNMRRFTNLDNSPAYGVTMHRGASNALFQGHDFIQVRPQLRKGLHILKSKDYDKDGFFDVYTWLSAGMNLQIDGTGNVMFYCTFLVKEDCTCRIDIDLTYSLDSFVNLYGSTDVVSYSSREYNYFGSNISFISLTDLTGDSDTAANFLEINLLDKMGTQTIATRNIHNLKAGTYQIGFHINDGYNNNHFHKMRIKDMGVHVVTSDLTKVEILENNFDCLKLFDNVEQYMGTKSRPTTRDAGVNRVLKQSSDLGGTKNYRFNKVKL